MLRTQFLGLISLLRNDFPVQFEAFSFGVQFEACAPDNDNQVLECGPRD